MNNLFCNAFIHASQTLLFVFVLILVSLRYLDCIFLHFMQFKVGRNKKISFNFVLLCFVMVFVVENDDKRPHLTSFEFAIKVAIALIAERTSVKITPTLISIFFLLLLLVPRHMTRHQLSVIKKFN